MLDDSHHFFLQIDQVPIRFYRCQADEPTTLTLKRQEAESALLSLLLGQEAAEGLAFRFALETAPNGAIERVVFLACVATIGPNVSGRFRSAWRLWRCQQARRISSASWPTTGMPGRPHPAACRSTLGFEQQGQRTPASQSPRGAPQPYGNHHRPSRRAGCPRFPELERANDKGWSARDDRPRRRQDR